MKKILPIALALVAAAAVFSCKKDNPGPDPDPVVEIKFSDKVAETACLRHFDADKNGVLTDKEAAAVTTFPDKMFTDEERAKIVSFDELKYFTGLTEIADSCLVSSPELTSVTIPTNVKVLGEKVFRWCKKLTTVNLSEGLEVIKNREFDGCEALSDIKLPSTLKSIGYQSFRFCAFKKFTIPEGVTEIEWETFYSCESLEEITIPSTVTKIGRLAFAHCKKLEKITIPASVTEMEMQVFWSSLNDLKHVYCPATTPAKIGAHTFDMQRNDSELKIHVPAASAEAYKAAWTEYKDFIVGDL